MMTQSNLLSVVTIAGLFSGSLWAGPQEGGLEQELVTHFAPTKFEKSKLVKPGVVLAVQKEGIGAISPKGGISMGRLGGSDLAYPNNYKSGTIHHDGKGLFLTNAGDIRDLAVNEQVYVLKIEVKDSSIFVQVQSCGTCDPKLPDPEHVPARANVSFQLGKPYLSAATPSQVEEIISHVFAPPAADSGASNQPAPQAAAPQAPPQAQAQPAAPMAPIPPPPPPPDAAPAAPVEVKIGQTTDEVKAALGQPVQIFNLGAKVVYKYKSLKVTFVNGKVSDVE
jgi:hypothetical protein